MSCHCAAECQVWREKQASVFCAPLLCNTHACAGLEGGEDSCEICPVVTHGFNMRMGLTILWSAPLAEEATPLMSVYESKSWISRMKSLITSFLDNVLPPKVN